MKKQHKYNLHKYSKTALLFVLFCILPSYSAPELSYISTDYTKIKLERTTPYKPNSVINIKATQPSLPETGSGETIIDAISKYFTGTQQNTDSSQDIKIEETSNETKFIPNPANDAFTPPTELIDTQNSSKTSENNDKYDEPENSKPPENYLPEDDYSDTYVAGINEFDNPEGKTIKQINIEGLKYLHPDTVYSYIKTKSGDSFDSNILQADLQNIYSSGYFTDNIYINPVISSDNTIELTFVLQENVPVKNVEILGNTVIKTSDLEGFVTPLKDMPQNIEHINKAIEQINECYHSRGYILEDVKNVDDDEFGNLKFYISEGTINNIIIEGNNKTKNFVIERNIFSEPGTVYNEEQLKKDIAKIYATNIFKDVSRELIPVEKGEKGEYDVKLIVKEASSNSVSIGGGIDNALGLFGQISINENNFLGRGQRLSLSGLLGSGLLLSDASIKNRMNYQVELNFFEPHFLNADNSLLGKLFYKELGSYQVPLAIERRFGLMASVDHKVKGQDNLTTSLSAGIEHISLSEGDLNKIASMYAKNNLDFALRKKELTGGLFFNIAPGIKYNSLDTKENPREGIIAGANFQESIGIDNIGHSSGRLIGSATKYFPIAKKSSLSLTARGAIKIHGNEMPEVMALSLGGPYSIRGFRMNGVGSGDGFLMGSAEFATPLPFMDKLKYDFFKKIRFTVFVDAGKVYDGTIGSKLYDRPMSAITIGIGLKFYVPNVGPISIDYGIPLTNPGNYGSKAGYFTFGTGMLDMYGY